METRNLKNLQWEPVSHNEKIKKRVMIKYGDLGPITQFSQAVFPPGEKAMMHTHQDMTELFFIQSGRGVIRTDNSTQSIIEGMCIIVHPKEMHEIENTENEEMIILCLGLATKDAKITKPCLHEKMRII